ncbi:hypothetical protein [Xanthomonas maliensis]|uniref:hypothetical protein n=1 Tax=Xanthomonas maliensis TaxID=1321368 RepID=UPI0012656A09|nr:hypothetical protein [Xanthomonas maliensis]
MKAFTLTGALLMSSVTGAAVAALPHGELVYASERSGTPTSLAFKRPDGAKIAIFEQGFDFSYDKADDTSNTSRGGAYSVVQFSENGELTGGQGTSGTESLYYCAFVRMADGCVVKVSEGQICGGAWGTDGHWHTTPDGPAAKIDNDPPHVSKVYKGYAAGLKDATFVTSPRILAYLEFGTTVDNLLVCDPPGTTNTNTYQQLIAALKRDKDDVNAIKIQAALTTFLEPHEP